MSILSRHYKASELSVDRIEEQIASFARVFGLSRGQSLQMFYEFTEAFLTSEREMRAFKHFLDQFFTFEDDEDLKRFMMDYCFLLTANAEKQMDICIEMVRREISCERILELIKAYPFFLFGKKGRRARRR